MRFRTENEETAQVETSRMVSELTPGTAFVGQCSASMLNAVSSASRENGKTMHAYEQPDNLGHWNFRIH